jgi:peptidoglycan hydrolase-like protein with peptidoglycan-binding domain
MSQLLKIGVVLVLFAGVSLAAPKTQHKKNSTAKHGSVTKVSKTSHGKSSRRHSRRGAWKRHGQQEIRNDRALEIQQALIREKYLTGAPTGEWDSRTQQAMSKFQGDNGWQTKVTPDSRALIKLGLGPDHEKDLATLDTKADLANPAASVSSGNQTKR